MSEQQGRAPLRFWIGVHKDGSGRQCIVDFDGGPMEGVKAAWNERNPDRVTTMEAVVRPELDPATGNYLELLKRAEGVLGDPRLPALEKFLRAVALAAFEAGMRNAGLRGRREGDR
jgi:hypothetical protein